MGKMKQMMDKVTGKGDDALPDVDTSADDAFLHQVNHDAAPGASGADDKSGDAETATGAKSVY